MCWTLRRACACRLQLTARPLPPHSQGVCYGKLESFTLFLLLPALLLGHLTGLVPEGGERALAGVAAALLALFAGRKWTQPIKDDIGGEASWGLCLAVGLRFFCCLLCSAVGLRLFCCLLCSAAQGGCGWRVTRGHTAACSAGQASG